MSEFAVLNLMVVVRSLLAWAESRIEKTCSSSLSWCGRVTTALLPSLKGTWRSWPAAARGGFVLNSKKANAQVRIPFVGATGMKIALYPLLLLGNMTEKPVLKAGVWGFVMSIKI